jgi:hypothetical protein
MEPLQGSLDPAGSAGADHPRDSNLRSEVSHRPDQPFRFDQPSPRSDSQISQPHMIASDEGHRCSDYSSRSAASGQRESIPVFRFPDHPWTRRGMSRVSRIPERFSPEISPPRPPRSQRIANSHHFRGAPGPKYSGAPFPVVPGQRLEDGQFLCALRAPTVRPLVPAVELQRLGPVELRTGCTQ